MKKTVRIILIVLAYTNLAFTIIICIKNHQTKDERIVEPLKALYYRDLESQVIHNKDCSLADELDNFDIIWTQGEYEMWSNTKYTHCTECM